MKMNEVVISMADYKKKKRKAAEPKTELGPPLCPHCGREAEPGRWNLGPKWVCRPCLTVIR